MGPVPHYTWILSILLQSWKISKYSHLSMYEYSKSLEDPSENPSVGLGKIGQVSWSIFVLFRPGFLGRFTPGSPGMNWIGWRRVANAGKGLSSRLCTWIEAFYSKF